MARIILPKHSSGPENDGERRVIEFFLDNLPPKGIFNAWNEFGQKGSEYIIIPNIEIPDGYGSFLEIDAIVVAPHAVYLVETKDWGPHIQGDDHEWYINQTRERKNPHRSLNYKCRVLLSLIEKASADISQKVWFQSVVVIARDNVVLELEGQSQFTTYPMNQLLISYLNDPLQLSARHQVSENVAVPFQKEIVETIIGKGQNHEPGNLIIQGFQVEEILHTQQGLTEYLGRSIHGHQPGTLKRLRVFSLPVYAQAEERKALEQKILRDYDVLEAIGTHPNIVSLKGLYEHEAAQVVEVLDWAEEGTLRSAMSQGTLTIDQKISIVKGIASGLKAIHEKGIIHRDLRPENILMTPSVPQLMNFDRAFMARNGLATVWSTIQADMDRRYLPPELALPEGEYDVFESSDLYSLGVIFYELLCGDMPYEGPEGLQAAGGAISGELLPTKCVPGLPEWTDSIVQRLYASDVNQRYANTDEFLADLHEKTSYSPNQVKTPLPEPDKVDEENGADPNRLFQVGERVGDYRIIRHVKSGGFAQVYLVTHVLHDKEYALKVYNASVPISSLIDEFSMLSELEHPNIVKVYWCGQLSSSRYYIAMEYLKGEPLNTYAWGNKKLPVSQVLEVGKQVIDALRYLHEGGRKTGDLAGRSLYHRDVKPSNLIWVPERGYVLIDFNIAKEASQSDTFTGTGAYIAPDLIHGTRISWDESGDTFALGVTLYELICKQHPYPNKTPQINMLPIDPRATKAGQDISDEVRDFLYKAVKPLTENRFKSSQEMEESLLSLTKRQIYKAEVTQLEAVFELDENEEGLTNYNPFVRRLRRLFSQAKYSNAGTRGLDEIARLTYIPTKLDEELVPAILNGEYKLVIITGNAGDGKTALIQQLESKSNDLKPLPSNNGGQFSINGVSFRSNYDGSQDEGDKPNDLVLEEFLKPFAGLKDFSKSPEGRILAINEGRLMEFLCSEERREGFGYLYEVVDRYFNERGERSLPQSLMIVNLNWRSIVAGDDDVPSLMEKQLQEFLKERFWASCSSCEYKERCFIYCNAQSLSDKAAGAEIRQRLSQIFEVVHLRRRLHITMRDLRSALSFIVCRDYGCEDIPELLKDNLSDEERLNYVRLAFWNATDSESKDVGDQDRLIHLLREIDLGLVAQPSLDRNLHFLSLEHTQLLSMETRLSDYTKDILTNIQTRVQKFTPGDMSDDDYRLVKHHHKLLVRKVYFEGRDVIAWNRLPYRNLQKFESILVDDYKEKDLAEEKLIQAISLSEGCRNQELATQNICISAGREQDPRWKSFRLFPREDFEIIIPGSGNIYRYLEHTPDCFIMRHKLQTQIALEVNLDLFELMSYISQGYSPSQNDLQGHYIEFVIFRNTLQHLPYRSVIITEDHERFYRISATDDNKLVMGRV